MSVVVDDDGDNDYDVDAGDVANDDLPTPLQMGQLDVSVFFYCRCLVNIIMSRIITCQRLSRFDNWMCVLFSR